MIIKPYIGGGFGNKQDALYEPLCAWCSTQVGGRCVRMDCAREETFVSNRVRHAIRFHIISWIRKDGQLAARKVECFSNQGAYASHGHSICAKAMGSFAQHLSLRQHGVRRLDRVYQPARGGRHAWLRYASGQLC
ncbi:MAG: molybdopterin cofactor-binding domain-containing protein [Dysosmobacter sp.]